jgi:hypothetical protein
MYGLMPLATVRTHAGIRGAGQETTMAAKFEIIKDKAGK